MTMAPKQVRQLHQRHECFVCSVPFQMSTSRRAAGKSHNDDTNLCTAAECMCVTCHTLSQAARLCVALADVVGCTPETVATLMASTTWYGYEQEHTADIDLVPYKDRPLSQALATALKDTHIDDVTLTAQHYYQNLPADHIQALTE